MKRTNKLLKKKIIKFCDYVANALVNHPDNIRDGIPFCVDDQLNNIIVPLRDVRGFVNIGSLWGDDGDDILSLNLRSKTLKDNYNLDIKDTGFYDDYLAILNRAKFTTIRYKG